MFFDHVILLDEALKRGILPELETFACPYSASGNKQGVIRIAFPEFTCVCPKTGYPDFATIYLLYLPHSLCLELKAWKLYLNTFRMIGTFHETVTSHLFNRLTTLLQPHWIMVIGSFIPRGNVETVIVFESDSTRPAGADLLLPKLTPRCSHIG